MTILTKSQEILRRIQTELRGIRDLMDFAELTDVLIMSSISEPHK